MCPSKPPRPRFTEEEAAALAEEIYGMNGQIQELPSERDQNFLLLHIAGQTRYVLKIANALEKRDVLELQTRAVRHLTGNVPEFTWPDTQATIAGEDIAVVKHRDGTDHFVRLMTYLPGLFLARVKPHQPGLLHSLGVFLASMDREVRGTRLMSTRFRRRTATGGLIKGPTRRPAASMPAMSRKLSKGSGSKIKMSPPSSPSP
jgi:Ser/Thr protein kinase RdoA (MazF antagonist)